MSITESKLSLVEAGDDFALRRTDQNGSVTTITLSETDIITLAQSVPAMQQQILSRHVPKGFDYSPIAATEACQIELHEEILGEAILLTMISQSGSRATFAVNPQLAHSLVTRLPVFLARIAAVKSSKQ
jgi:hypothetical protein